MTTRWGPEPADGQTTFRLWAPDRDAVTLEIDGGDPLAMERGGGGWFAATAPVGSGARYRFRLSDDLAVPDPASRGQAGGVNGWSVVDDPAAYRWRTADWAGRPWKPW